jgi:hypothetical protein
MGLFLLPNSLPNPIEWQQVYATGLIVGFWEDSAMTPYRPRQRPDDKRHGMEAEGRNRLLRVRFTTARPRVARTPRISNHWVGAGCRSCGRGTGQYRPHTRQTHAREFYRDKLESNIKYLT